MNENGFGYKRITETATLKNGGGVLKGFFVSSFSESPTIIFYDNTDASGNIIVGTFTITATGFFDCGTIGFGTGLHAVISGTATVTVAVK